MSKIKHMWLWLTALVLLFTFFFFRPLNSPSYRIIVADGLGYYSYLPATFIYHDSDLNFAWFPEVFRKYYNNDMFSDPLRHFMVDYGDRRINLYYPGVSLLQAPFFLIAHALAPATGYDRDGFSLPYQLAMGLAAIFYTMLGIWLCYKICMDVFPSRARLAVLTVLFGTPLFTYSVFSGCYSHAYSFFAIALFYRLAQLFFAKRCSVISTIMAGLLVVTIRPVNAITLFGSLYFFNKSFLNRRWFSRRDVLPILLLVLVAGYNVRIAHIQTGHIVANTYTIGHFLWNRWDRIVMNVFGFQTGMVFYEPVLLLALGSAIFLKRDPRLFFPLFTAVGMIVIYSLWWYWSIMTRTLVDISAIFIIMLAVLLKQLQSRPKTLRFVTLVIILCAGLFQLKAYQLRNGILHANYTYSKYYIRDFFRVHHADVYPVNPTFVLHRKEDYHDFEDAGEGLSNDHAHHGESSLMIDDHHEFAGTLKYALPPFLFMDGFPKYRASFWYDRTERMTDTRLVFTFTRHDSILHYIPVYFGKNSPVNKWDHKEFGGDIPDDIRPTDSLTIYFWNPERRNTAWIDELKMEFFLTNGGDEITEK